LAKNVDPAAIHAARRQLMRLVGATLGRQLAAIYEQLGDPGPYSPDAASAGRRALRNAALTLLAARDEKADRSRVFAHYRSASNMSDEAHALYLLAGSRNPERETALEHFYERWRHDHIVIDTWFAAQAISPMAKTLARVRALTRHPLFSLTAPNKVRALIGNFAAANPVQFNRPDGAGFQFVAEQVLALDRFNPQVAARMLGTFRSWRSLEPVRRNKAKSVLRGVAKTKGLSRDVYEIVHKMIE